MPDHYKLYYWPIPFRGHFIRYVLAHVGATWEETGFSEMGQFKNQPLEDKPYPFLAPPVLYDQGNDKYLGQLAAILMYLGRKYDLIGDKDEALRIINDALDILLEITRMHGAQMWDEQSWEAFVTTRLPAWLAIHERWLSEQTASSPFAHGRAKIGLSDLVLTALWHTMADKLPNMRGVITQHAPTLMAHADTVAETPEISAVRKDWETSATLYCAGQIEASILEMLNKRNPPHEPI